MRDSWSLGPLSSITFDERKAIKKACKEQIDSYQQQAADRYNNEKNTSLMISKEQH